jgi:hypothetical protein
MRLLFRQNFLKTSKHQQRNNHRQVLTLLTQQVLAVEQLV